MKRAGRTARVSERALVEYYETTNAVVVDTHVWVGYLDPSAYPLPARVVERLGGAQQEGGFLVPEICIWEIAMKAGRGSMRLAPPVRAWVDRARAMPGTRTIPFSADVMLLAAELPSAAPNDPMDRAIIATAMIAGVPLVTADRSILAWARRAKAVQVVSAR